MSDVDTNISGQLERQLEIIRALLDERALQQPRAQLPATVDGYDPETFDTSLLVDGEQGEEDDEELMPAVNLTGVALSEGQRVMVEFVPPSGAVVVGLITEPEWTDYTPTLTNVTLGTDGVVSGRWQRVGGIVFFDAAFELGTGGSVSGRISIGLPFTAQITEPIFVVCPAWADNGVTSRADGTGIINGTEPDVVSRFAGGTGGLTADGWDTSTPHTWAAGFRLCVSGRYEPLPVVEDATT